MKIRMTDKNFHKMKLIWSYLPGKKPLTIKEQKSRWEWKNTCNGQREMFKRKKRIICKNGGNKWNLWRKKEWNLWRKKLIKKERNIWRKKEIYHEWKTEWMNDAENPYKN